MQIDTHFNGPPLRIHIPFAQEFLRVAIAVRREQLLNLQQQRYIWLIARAAEPEGAPAGLLSCRTGSIYFHFFAPRSNASSKDISGWRWMRDMTEGYDIWKAAQASFRLLK